MPTPDELARLPILPGPGGSLVEDQLNAVLEKYQMQLTARLTEEADKALAQALQELSALVAESAAQTGRLTRLYRFLEDFRKAAGGAEVDSTDIQRFEDDGGTAGPVEAL